MKRSKQSLALLVSGSVALATVQGGCAAADPSADLAAPPFSEDAAEAAPLSPDALNQLVAPIALYPDALVAQVLAASTYPTEIVEASRWIEEHSDLKGTALAQAVDQQSWDPSVKALTQFPSVLANLNKNLSWTSALGDAYANQQQDVLNSVQVMRERARQAGNLKSTPQETVTSDGQTIVIQPANPQVVYVPEYDPWLVYGAPVIEYPGWLPFPDLYLDGPGFAWGLSIGIFAGYGWGWHHWGADWHHHRLDFDHHAYVSRSPTFSGHGAEFGHFHGGPFHGFAAPHGDLGVRAGAFSGFDHGGVARGYSFRGRSSFAGGFHGGFASGFHGGGFHGGGGGHR